MIATVVQVCHYMTPLVDVVNESMFGRVSSVHLNHLNGFQLLRHVHFPLGILAAVAMVAILVVQKLSFDSNSFVDPVLLDLYQRL